MLTLVDGVRQAAHEGRGDLVFHLTDGPQRVRAGDLLEKASRAAATLLDRGVEPGDRIGLLGPTRPEWAVWAVATWLTGGVLVPMQIPLRVADPASFADRLRGATDAAGCRVVVYDPLFSSVVDAERSLVWDETAPRPASDLPVVTPEMPAILQYTSGSTSRPKGAVISHRAARTFLRGNIEHYPAPYVGRTCGWVPLFHDLGLICHFIYPLLELGEGHLIPTELFARNPAGWLQLAGEVGADHLLAPQSSWLAAFAAAVRKGIPLDLQAVQVATFAAEGIDPDSVDHLTRAGAAFGLRPECWGGSYGLAEATLAVTIPKLHAGVRTVTVDRDALLQKGIAHDPVGAPRRVASAGSTLKTQELRITRDGEPVGDDVVGDIEVGGPCLMDGYFGSDVASPIRDGWLTTGDRGFVRDGDLYVVGRVKDMIIVAGQNYYPEDFEWAAQRVPGVRPGRAVAVADPSTEKVVLVIEATDDAPADLASTVSFAIADSVGTPPGRVLVVPRGTIPKTTSGKLQRHAVKDALQDGSLSE